MNHTGWMAIRMARTPASVFMADISSADDVLFGIFCVSWYSLAHSTKGPKLMLPSPVTGSQPSVAGKPNRHKSPVSAAWLSPCVMSVNASAQFSAIQ